MTESSLQTLLSTKAALDLGLITQADFDSVKGAFLRAQQIKAAVDAGLIKAEDYESVKQQYLSSLDGVPPPAVGAAPAPAAAPRAAQQPQQQHHRSASTPSLPAEPAPRAAPQQQAAPPRPAPAARPPAPPPAAEPAAAAPAAAAAPSAPRSTAAAASNGIGAAAVPTNIPKMGGVKPKSGGTSMSGISVSEDAVNLFYLMKAKSAYRWALWQVDDAGSTVVIAAVGDQKSAYGDFLAALPDSDCRYGVFDYQYTTPDGQTMNKLVFLNWAPDSAKVKSKMMYASTKDFFKGHLDGISAEFQASDLDEVTEEEVASAVRALKRG